MSSRSKMLQLLLSLLASSFSAGCGDANSDSSPWGTLYVAHVFQPTFDDGMVERLNVDGSGRELVADIGGGLRGLVVDQLGGRIIYSDVDEDKILQRDLSPGSASTSIIDTGLEFPMDLKFASFAARLVWMDTSATRIEASELDGRNRYTVGMIDVGVTIGVDEVNQHIYTEDRISARRGAILRLDLSGDDVEVVVDDVPTATEIAVDPLRQVIYWTSSAGLANGDGGVYCVNFDGTGFKEIFVEEDMDTGGLVLDLEGGFAYFGLQLGQGNSSDIIRIELDGANPEIIATGYGDITELVYVTP